MGLTKQYIFLLGRPGCGKSAVYNQLKKRLAEEKLADDFPRVDDFPKLWAKFQNDDALERQGQSRLYSRKTEDGGYKIIRDELWDELLKEVNADIVSMSRPGRVVFVEFSRDSYERAFKNFTAQVLDRALALYIEVPFEICWERNVERHKKALAAGSDDHLVSKEEMEKTYKIDDGASFAAQAPCPVEMIDNSQKGEESLKRQIESIVNILKKKYSR